MPAKVGIKSCRRAGGCVSFVYECSYPAAIVFVTGFAKRGLPHTSNIANLMSYNFSSVCASHFKLSHNFLYVSI